VSQHTDDLSACRASLDDGLLTLENDRIRREYRWTDGDLIGVCLLDKTTDRAWPLAGVESDMAFPGAGSATGGDLTVTPSPARWFRPAHLQADVDTRFGPLTVRRRFRIYPGCPAIACDIYLRGRSDREWGGDGAAVMERLCIEPRHLHLEGVQFFDITDRRNTLVMSRSITPYRRPISLPGNLLLVRDVLSNSGDGLFILKEAPCSDVQLADAGADFVSRIG